MEKVAPLKRSEELKPLSRDHHLGLQLCWKIRMGIDWKIAPERISKYVIFIYNIHLKPHFHQEEQYVFTLLEKNNEKTRIAIDDHNQIKKLVDLIYNNISEYVYLKQFEEHLRQHIRYEERVLFPYIELYSNKSKLIVSGQIIASLHDDIIDLDWMDEFWIKKN